MEGGRAVGEPQGEKLLLTFYRAEFPRCAHDRQTIPDGRVLPCATPGCLEGVDLRRERLHLAMEDSTTFLPVTRAYRRWHTAAKTGDWTKLGWFWLWDGLDG
jgi:hypothetical protein